MCKLVSASVSPTAGSGAVQYRRVGAGVGAGYGGQMLQSRLPADVALIVGPEWYEHGINIKGGAADQCPGIQVVGPASVSVCVGVRLYACACTSLSSPPSFLILSPTLLSLSASLSLSLLSLCTSAQRISASAQCTNRTKGWGSQGTCSNAQRHGNSPQHQRRGRDLHIIPSCLDLHAGFEFRLKRALG